MACAEAIVMKSVVYFKEVTRATTYMIAKTSILSVLRGDIEGTILPRWFLAHAAPLPFFLDIIITITTAPEPLPRFFFFILGLVSGLL